MSVTVDLARPADLDGPLRTAVETLALGANFPTEAKLAKVLLKDLRPEDWETFGEAVAEDLFSTFTTQIARSGSKIVEADARNLACAVWNGFLVFVVYAEQDGRGPLYYSIAPNEPARQLADHLGDRLYQILLEVPAADN